RRGSVGRARQCVDGEPPGIADLGLLHLDLSTRVASRKSNHQLAWKWPGLAAEVAEVGDGDPDLLSDLASHRPLECLARLHEPRHESVEARAHLTAVGEQDLGTAMDQSD